MSRLFLKYFVNNFLYYLILLNVICFPFVNSQMELDLEEFHPEILSKALKLAQDPNSMERFSSCAICNEIARTFKKRIEKTAQNHLDQILIPGSKIKPYQDSIIRLAEITENVCEDSAISKVQCEIMAEELDEEIENWWTNVRSTGKSLYDFLCVEKLKLCCPKNKFGPNCQECPGYPDNVCGHHGTCDGKGTLNGTGKCKCFRGYSGKNCEECLTSYYPTVDKQNKFICNPCHKNCKNGCVGSESKDCKLCGDDAYLDPIKGCLKLNECSPLDYNPCDSGLICRNTQSSLKCFINLISFLLYKKHKNNQEYEINSPFISFDKCCKKYCRR